MNVTNKDMRTSLAVYPFEIVARITFNQKFVNKYLRPIWRMEMEDNTFIDEVLEDGSELNWKKDLDINKIKRMHIISKGSVPLSTPSYSVVFSQRKFDFWLDVSTGVFYMDLEGVKDARVLECSNLPVKYDLICFKEATAALVQGAVPTLQYVAIGYKVNWNGFLYKAIAKVTMDTKVIFEVSKTNIVTGEKIQIPCDQM